MSIKLKIESSKLNKVFSEIKSKNFGHRDLAGKFIEAALNHGLEETPKLHDDIEAFAKKLIENHK